MQESTLHNQLKNLYTREGGIQEAWVDGYWVDILHGQAVTEIQTGNFSAIKPKLIRLLRDRPILLVHPIIRDKWIIRQDGDFSARRRSPRRGRIEDLFYELVRFPQLVQDANLTLEVVFVEAEELRRKDGKGSWRRKGWSIVDRRILRLNEQIQFQTPADFRRLLPAELNSTFTVRELSSRLGIPVNLAGKMTYCCYHMGLLQVCGKQGKAQVYRQVESLAP